ncbi:hypothetical protein VCRLGP8_250035 [Vibrio crassostreae]|nr:hypothetical protein VCRLGP7_30035 [Vibrio crassostreae]CDT34500.1 hypothetical protein VCRLGP107_460188 [Vibrio crassostreae]CDT36591.1 hypothetical protein VCR20J5_230008 [Vibrio crassostreae]CDT41284.1 hypothetical protein VCRLGP8_250035 [Vibrio crassostreae]
MAAVYMGDAQLGDWLANKKAQKLDSRFEIRDSRFEIRRKVIGGLTD